MESSADHEQFKYIPFRCYLEDGYRQKLVKPLNEDGRKKTLQDLLNEMFPSRSDGEYLNLLLAFYLSPLHNLQYVRVNIICYLKILMGKFIQDGFLKMDKPVQIFAYQAVNLRDLGIDYSVNDNLSDINHNLSR